MILVCHRSIRLTVEEGGRREERMAVSNTHARNVFKPVYGLVRKGALSEALLTLKSESTGRINREFTQDKNHAWYVIGDILFKMKKYRESLAAFKKALRDWPDDPDALAAAGDCFSALGNHSFAEKYYRMSNGIKPRPDTQYNIANELLDQKRYKTAYEMYQSIRTADPDLKNSIKLNSARAQRLMG